jgi:Peptidase M50B-like
MLSMAGEFQKPLPAPDAILIGLLAAFVVLVRALWQIVRPFETVVHESAHVLAGILTGRTIRSVRIEEAGGGSTDMVPKSGCGYGVAAFVGYIGPSAAGLIAAGLISTGRMYAVLWLGLVLLAVMLLAVRNFFGGIAIITCGVLLYLVVRYGTAGVETAAAYGVAWFLLISGTRMAISIAGRPGEVTDAGVLADMIFVWRWVWCLVWLAGTLAALAIGGRILIRGLGGL